MKIENWWNIARETLGTGWRRLLRDKKTQGAARSAVARVIRRRRLVVGPDGRCYPKFIPSPPKGTRWEKGEMVLRHG